MNTIEEIAKSLCLCAEVGEKCKSCPNNEDGCNNMRCSDWRQYDAAKRAIEEAQRWISVEDELPENSDEEVFYLIRQSHGNITLAGSYRNNIFWSKAWIQIKDVTHWRHIEIK